jgi:hypothetical protein
MRLNMLVYIHVHTLTYTYHDAKAWIVRSAMYVHDWTAISHHVTLSPAKNKDNSVG